MNQKSVQIWFQNDHVIQPSIYLSSLKILDHPIIFIIFYFILLRKYFTKMSLTQQVIKSQKEKQQKTNQVGVSEKNLIKQLEQQEKALQDVQNETKDESNIRLDKRENISIQRKRQIENHRNGGRYVKEGIKYYKRQRKDKSPQPGNDFLKELSRSRESFETLSSTGLKTSDKNFDIQNTMNIQPGKRSGSIKKKQVTIIDQSDEIPQDQVKLLGDGNLYYMQHKSSILNKRNSNPNVDIPMNPPEMDTNIDDILQPQLQKISVIDQHQKQWGPVHGLTTIPSQEHLETTFEDQQYFQRHNQNIEQTPQEVGTTQQYVVTPQELMQQAAMRPSAIMPSDFELYNQYKMVQQLSPQNQMPESQMGSVVSGGMGSSGISKVQAIGQRYSPKMIDPIKYKNQAQQDTDVFKGVLPAQLIQQQQLMNEQPNSGTLAFSPTKSPGKSPNETQSPTTGSPRHNEMQSQYLQDIHDLMISGSGQAPNYSYGNPSGQGQSSPMATGMRGANSSGAININSTLANGSMYSNKKMKNQLVGGTKKILFQRQTGINKGSEEHIKYLNSTKASKFGVTSGPQYQHIYPSQFNHYSNHPMPTQNEKFQSIPENVIYEATMGGTVSTKIGFNENKNRATLQGGQMLYNSNNFERDDIRSPQDMSVATNLRQAKYMGKSDLSVNQVDSRNVNSRNITKGGFGFDKTGKISLNEQNGRETIMAKQSRASPDLNSPKRKQRKDEKETETEGKSSVMTRINKNDVNSSKPLSMISSPNPIKDKQTDKKASEEPQVISEERAPSKLTNKKKGRATSKKKLKIKTSNQSKSRLESQDSKVPKNSDLNMNKTQNDLAETGRQIYNINMSQMSQSPKYDKVNDNASSQRAADRFGVSMYNVSPIEVYIENRSVAGQNFAQIGHSMRNQLQKTSNSRGFQFPKIGHSGMNNSKYYNMSPRNQRGGGMVHQAGQTHGQNAMKIQRHISPKGPNPNNPYLSYYIGNKKNQKMKNQETNANILPLMSVNVSPGMTRPNSKDRKNLATIDHSVSPSQFSHLSKVSRNKIGSKLNMQPIYRKSQINDQEIEIGGSVIESQQAMIGASPSLRETNYLINELQDLQEQTAEDMISNLDGMQERKEALAQKALHESGLFSLASENNATPYDAALSVMSQFRHYEQQSVSPRVDAFKSKEVEKVLQLYANQNLLEGNTAIILQEISTLANKKFATKKENTKQIIEDRALQNYGEDDGRSKTIQPQHYSKYKNDGKVLVPELYTNEKTIADKRNYEELYYRARQQQRMDKYIDILETKMNKKYLTTEKQKAKEDPLANLIPKFMDEKELDAQRAKKIKLPDQEYIKMGYRSPQAKPLPKQLSGLENLLEKQQLVLNTDGQEMLQIENIIDEESNAKIDMDNQIQARLRELMDKGLYFTSSTKKKKKYHLTDRDLKRITEGKAAHGADLENARSTLTKGWEVGEGWETDVMPLSPTELDKKKNKQHLERRKKLDESSLISERWQAIQADPTISKDDVLPQNDEVLQQIQERYMGRDDEYNRRKRTKDRLLNKEKLYEVFKQDQIEKEERELENEYQQQPSGMQQQQYGQDAQSVQAAVNPFDLPRTKLSKNTSKLSLSPSNIMIGGNVKELDVEMRNFIAGGGSLARNFSRSTLQPGMNRNLSQKTIASMMSVEDAETNHRKLIKVVQALQTEKKLNKKYQPPQLDKILENSIRDEKYGECLKDSSVVLPSLFRSEVASVALPELDIISNRYGAHKKQSDSGQTATLNVRSLRQLDEQQNMQSILKQRGRKFKSLATSRNQDMPPLMDFIKDSLNTTKKLNEFGAQIRGIPDPNNNPQAAVYYRKQLSLLENRSPKVRPVGAVGAFGSSLTQQGKSRGVNIDKDITQMQLKEGFKKPLYNLKAPQRYPPFQLTEFAQNIKDQANQKLMRAQGAKLSQETGEKIREMLEQII